jgi:hypothetical protein
VSKSLPMVWRDAVCDSDALPSAAKLVAFTLARYMNRDGVAYPAVETLAARSGYDVRYVRRQLRLLKETGFLDFDESNKGGRGKSNRYRARLPKSAENRRQSEWERAVEERELVAAEREELAALREEMAGCVGGVFKPEWATPEWQAEVAERERRDAARGARWEAEIAAGEADDEEPPEWLRQELREEREERQAARAARREAEAAGGDDDAQPKKKPNVCPECKVGGGLHAVICPTVEGGEAA